MTDRREKLSNMLNATSQRFQKILLESSDFLKMARHSGMKIDKQQMAQIMARMAERMDQNVKNKTNEMIRDNLICERFDELEALQRTSEKVNEQLRRPAGYHHINPKRDIGLHLADSSAQLHAATDAEIERLERELAGADEEHDKKKALFDELAAVVESQQKKLWA